MESIKTQFQALANIFQIHFIRAMLFLVEILHNGGITIIYIVTHYLGLALKKEMHTILK